MAGSFVQATQVQRTQSAEKDRNARRETELKKNVALDEDRLEHQVESSDTVAAIHDEQTPQDQPRKQHKHQHEKDEDDDRPHLDLRA